MRALLPQYICGGIARTAGAARGRSWRPIVQGLAASLGDGAALRRWNGGSAAQGGDRHAPTDSPDATTISKQRAATGTSHAVVADAGSTPSMEVELRRAEIEQRKADRDALAARYKEDIEERRADRAAEAKQREADCAASAARFEAEMALRNAELASNAAHRSMEAAWHKDRSRQEEEQARWGRFKQLFDVLVPVLAVIIGAKLGGKATYDATSEVEREKAARDQQQREAEEKHKQREHQKMVVKRADVLRGQLDAALGLLRRARQAYLAQLDPAYARAYLFQASDTITHAEDWMCLTDLPRAEVLQALIEPEAVQALIDPQVRSGKVSVDWEACVSDMRACINYHLAALQLRGEDGVSEQNVLVLLGKSLALREAAAAVAATPPHDGLVANERARGTIKWADTLSRQSKPLDALHMYQDADIVGQFLVVRATNNRAAVQFGRGDDGAARGSVDLVARLAAEWLRRDPGRRVAAPEALEAAAAGGADWWRDAAAVQAAAAVGAALTYDKAPEGLASAGVGPALLKLIRLGVDDAVDVLHLPALGAGQAARGGTGSPLAMERLTLADLQSASPGGRHNRQLAIECLERVKLVVRKYYTSRANGLLVAAAPYSRALEGEDATKLIALLRDLCTDPWPAQSGGAREEGEQPPYGSTGFGVLAALNADWMKQEGVARLCAALGLGLVELARACPHDEDHTDLRQRLLGHANHFTSLAKTRLAHARTPLPDVHSCVVAVARARYSQTMADDSAALAELQEPAVPATKSILQWSRERQLRDEILAKQQPSVSLHAPMSASPRHARWQATVLAYALDLRGPAVSARPRGWLGWLGSGWLLPALASPRDGLDLEPWDKNRQALAFAVLPFCSEHPLRQVAKQQVVDAQVPLQWTAGTDAAAVELLTAIERWGADLAKFLSTIDAASRHSR